MPASQTTRAERPNEWQSLGDVTLRQGQQAVSLSDFGIDVTGRLATTPDSRMRPEVAPARWVAEAMLYPDAVRGDGVFRITNAELIAALGWTRRTRGTRWTMFCVSRPGKLAELLTDASRTPARSRRRWRSR